MNFTEVDKLLTTDKNICITAHYRPDGDAIGSSMGLYHFLKNKGCENVRVVMPSDFAKNLKWVVDANKIVIHNPDSVKARKAIAKADILFCLDYNEPKRVGGLEEDLVNAKAIKILIDHHPNPDKEFAQHIFSDISYSSTCEMIHFFIENTGNAHLYNQTIAECLYMGILTDTGGFRYATSKRLMETAGYLLEVGVNDSFIINKVFDSNPVDKIMFMGHCLGNQMEVLRNLRTSIIYATEKDFERFNYQPGFTDGIVNQALGIENIVCSVFVSPDKNFTKLSFRSKGNFAVNEIAKKYFNGGGHRNAAGGRSEVSVTETIVKLKTILQEYKDDLLTTKR